MGNNTYKQSLTFKEFPFKNTKCYVFSKKEKRKNDENAFFVRENAKSFIGKLKPANNKKIWLVGGFQIISEFMKYDLIDEFLITIVPVILGEGIPLFLEKNNEKKLKFLGVKAFDLGLVQISYKMK